MSRYIVKRVAFGLVTLLALATMIVDHTAFFLFAHRLISFDSYNLMDVFQA